MSWKEQLPAVLQPYVEAFAATDRPCVRLNFLDQPPASRWASCLGRILYWPREQAWPTDENGRPLFGCLQLNLAELPTLPDWPSTGILQFFISDDPFWGAHPLEPPKQDNFRIIYHNTASPETDALLDDFSFLPLFENLPFQRDVSLAVSGTEDRMPMSPEDHRFPALFGSIFSELSDEQWTALNAYRKAIGTVGHRLGGYAGFVQDDPRPEDAVWELLLQLDSDPKHGLLWGDYGVAHWFYSPTPSTPPTERSLEAPASSPFAEVWYGWESQ